VKTVLRRVVFLSVIATLVGACGVSKRSDGNKMAETAGPHFATICIRQKNWPQLLATLKNFGSLHRMEMHGGIDTNTPNAQPMINVYLAQGYSYYFGDDFDIWFAGDPFGKDRIDVNGVVKRKPITREQQALATALLSEIREISVAPNNLNSDHPCPV
jgi:hypothetical protein